MSFAEQEYWTVSELAARLKVHRTTITRLFQNEPDVLVLGSRETTRWSRKLRHLRIPTHVVNRILRRLVTR